MSSIESLIAIGTSALTGFLTDILKRYGGRILDRADQKWTAEPDLKKAANEYVSRYAHRHGILKVLGMREPIFLDDIYTAAWFLEFEDINRYDSIMALEEFYRQRNRRSFSGDKVSTLPGIEIANDKQYLMVLGGPGAGKSTFLRKIGLEALKGDQPNGYQYACIPVFIELKSFRYRELDLELAIAKEFEICHFPRTKDFTREALRAGKLLVLLDGLDELPTEKVDETVIKIQDFVQRFDKNRFICSCRIAAYLHNFRQFTDIEIADFSDGQIKTFIRKWFQDKPMVGERCWNQLNNDSFLATKELAQTPLLLTLVCLLYQRVGQLPTNRATLYERALRIFLEEWDAEKAVPRESPYKGLDTRRKEILLQEIAYDTFERNELFFPQHSIARQIETLLQDMLPYEQHISGVDVLHSIEIQHGILVERSDGIYSFSHLTLQEFLTAQVIADSSRTLEELIKQHLTDERWREVFLLVAGLQRSADRFLLTIEEQATQYITSPKLKHFLQWIAYEANISNGSHQPVQKRITMIFFALIVANIRTGPSAVKYKSPDAIDRALNLVRHFDLKFSLGNINQIKESVYQELNIQLNDDLFRKFTKDISLSFEELQLLSNYLCIYIRLIECKNSAINFSRKTWTDIREKMFLIA